MRHLLAVESVKSVAGRATDWAYAHIVVGMENFRIREEKDGKFYVVSVEHTWHRPLQNCTDAVGPFHTFEEAALTLMLMGD